jgi:hypothetical protein
MLAAAYPFAKLPRDAHTQQHISDPTPFQQPTSDNFQSLVSKDGTA